MANTVKRFLEENANFLARNTEEEVTRLFRMARFQGLTNSYFSLLVSFQKYRRQKLGPCKRNSPVKDFILANANFMAKSAPKEIERLFNLSSKFGVSTTRNHIRISFYFHRSHDQKFLKSVIGKKWKIQSDKRKNMVRERWEKRKSEIVLKDLPSSPLVQ